MRKDGLALLVASLLAPALGGCGRPEGEARRDPSATAAPAPAPAPTVGPLASLAGETWNAAQIEWQPYEVGLAKAKAENKPVCLVLFTGWCPHCKNYSHVFEDAKVVEQSKRFVMIRINADERQDVAGKYAPDGGYVPRTFFLAPDGTLAADIHAPRPKYQYFYDERNPAPLLASMGEALGKLAR